LDEYALIKILHEPKNALVKQYQKLFEMDQVELNFEEDALKAIAKLAIERKTGARGLRSIVESVMLEVMYEIPSRKDIKKCVVTQDTIDNKQLPTILYDDDDKPKIKDKENAS